MAKEYNQQYFIIRLISKMIIFYRVFAELLQSSSYHALCSRTPESISLSSFTASEGSVFAILLALNTTSRPAIHMYILVSEVMLPISNTTPTNAHLKKARQQLSALLSSTI
jgi:hypothetical protein